MNKKIFSCIRVFMTFAILFALFKLVPYKTLLEVYKDAQKIYILYAFLALVFCYLIGVVRWNFLLSSLGIKVSLRETFYAFFSGLSFNLFFPSFVAGDVFRAFSISKRHGNRKKIVSTVLMDRFSGAVALVLIAIFSFIIARADLAMKSVVIPLFIFFALVLFAFLIMFSRSFFLFFTRMFSDSSLVKKKLVAFHDELYFFSENPKIFIKSLFFSFLIQIGSCLSFYIASKAFGLGVNLVQFFVLVPIVSAISLIPITIAGAGTREASAVYFFSTIGIDKSVGLGISLLNLVFMIFLGIVGGIIYVAIYHRWLKPDSKHLT